MSDLSVFEESIRKHALKNAIEYNGTAEKGAVMGRVMAEHGELRGRAKEIIPLVERIIKEVNELGKERQEALLFDMAPDMLVKEKKEKSGGLEDLPDVNGEVLMRLAPGPSGPLHLGHTRMAILNDEYVKRYGGKLFNRLEDTNPVKILPEAYDMIREDLDWLGVKCHGEVFQSDRFEIYYEHAKALLEMGKAYICDCDVEDWRKLKSENRACPHRELPPGEHLEKWDLMLANRYEAGDVSYIVRTDLDHPNPAVRDFVGFRIVEESHPRTGNKYSVYPLMNFSVAVDDHLLGLTHVLRGKDHLNNTYRQMYIFDYFGWKKPEYIHYGWVSIEDTILKTSVIKEGIAKGEFSGWDDPRLGTVRALKKRGIQAEAIRRYWIEVGIKEVDIKFSWENLYSYNKAIVDPTAKRYFFVSKPIRLAEIKGEKEPIGRAPLHPDHPEWDMRVIDATSGTFISADDLNGLDFPAKIRLKDRCNIELYKEGDLYIGDWKGNDLSFLKEDAKIIHWVPKDQMEMEVFMPDGRVVKGVCENAVADSVGEVVQFERFGFVNIVEENGKINGYFAHK